MPEFADLANDPRWLRLNDRSWICPCCNQAHGGIFDLVSAKPDYWNEQTESRMKELGNSRKHGLTDDLCVIDDEHFFVRCVLELPLLGAAGQHFGLGVWSSLSREKFDRYVETFEDDDQGKLGPMFGWLSNTLKGYPETLSLKCYVQPRNGRRRPLIELEQTDHPLAIDQRDGLSFDRLLEIYAANGHDMRTHLSER
jgi:hypothetical protein